jgi:hypothetical protein
VDQKPLKSGDEGKYTASGHKRAADTEALGEGEDGSEFGALMSQQVGRNTAFGENHEFGDFDAVGEHDGGWARESR